MPLKLGLRWPTDVAEPEDPDPIAAPSDTPARVETDDTPAPSAELTALPSTTATELIQRIKSVGSKNICEYSKKRADARSLGNSGRANLREQFTQKWYRSVRDFKPLEYILELPQPSVFERDHNQMWFRRDAEPYRRSRLE